ncbi:MAG: rod shape-determining protein RodA [Eubacterium sp.]|nr:rod shape-determining protein RodA [Eubacterium sp.]
MFKRYRLRDFNFILFIMVTGLMILGVFVINSADPNFTVKQAIGVGAAVVIMIVVSLVDYHLWIRLYIPAYLGTLVMLLAVLLFGNTVNNATRWFTIGGLTFQPSELAKTMMIIFMAALLERMIEDEKVSRPKGLLLFLGCAVVPLMLIFREPDLSTTLCLGVVMLLMLYLAGLSYKIIFITLLILIPAAGTFMWYISQPDQKLLNPYQVDRIMSFLNPSKYVDMYSQQANSIMAIGSGRLWGKGLTPDGDVVKVGTSGMISEQQTDFIFSVIGESFGFVGSVLVIAIILLVVLQCIRISRRAKDPSGMLLAGGAACLLAIQSFFNISVTTGILPNTGIPLPFISYGLTSLLSIAILIGIVLNVGMQPERW